MQMQHTVTSACLLSGRHRVRRCKELTGVRVPLTLSRIVNFCFLLRMTRAFCRVALHRHKA